MAKSIRSKIKRKHRAEFRATIGNDAYQATMSKVNGNLKRCIEEQSMSEDTFEKLSDLLGTSNATEDAMEDPDELPAIDAAEAIKPSLEVRGENKVQSRLTPSKRSKRRKHKLNSSIMKSERVAKEARKPRFFCQF